ncbi:MAG TPA: hypothetical protein VN622_09550 [Clostridia bacterium]|nr:hypothetical protein [Clostridia bacterium]
MKAKTTQKAAGKVQALSTKHRYISIGTIFIGTPLTLSIPVMKLFRGELGTAAYVLAAALLIEVTVGIGFLVKGLTLKEEQEF